MLGEVGDNGIGGREGRGGADGVMPVNFAPSAPWGGDRPQVQALQAGRSRWNSKQSL